MKINIELPFFPGFYESDLENGDTAYWAIREELPYYQEECDTPCKELTEDDLDFDYEGYETAVRDMWVDGFRGNVPDIVVSIENVEMTSPKYYNFSTDKLWADIELKDGWEDEMRAFIEENSEWLAKRIKEDWTSYDGFISFMDNDVNEWDEHLFEEQDARYISAMLGYMMYRKNRNIRDDLVMYALDDVAAGMYVVLNEKGEEKVRKDEDE